MNFKVLVITFLLVIPSVTIAKKIDWYTGHGNVTYTTKSKYTTVVKKAIDLFTMDMKSVTGRKAFKKKDGTIEIWQLDQIDEIGLQEIEQQKIPYHKIITKKDAFYIGIRNGKIVIAGSNGRGTAYGILELSRMAGVSPWVYWGDVTPIYQMKLSIDSKFETLQAPSVEYRGIFINDEDWSSRVWDAKNLDRKNNAIGPNYYRKLFELMLRLKANTLWPAMHPGTKAFFSVKGNKLVADSFDIYVGSSHCEPILRNNVAEWDERKMGPFNYNKSKKNIEKYWEERAKETADMDAIYTLGIRGIHDGGMQGAKTTEEKVKTLQKVIDSQRKMLKRVQQKELNDIPQVFVPYKEVLDIYDNGLKVPSDVTLLWCDDNYGYLTRLSDRAEQARKGGGGVYYHLSYWGRPHDWLWLCTIQPGLIFNEMLTAYNHNCRKMWIANVHDPKIAAYQLSLFMDMAWNINSVKANTIYNHLEAWLMEQFGKEQGRQLLPVMREFYHLTGIRRPEFMGWNQVELNKKQYDKGWSPVQNTEFNESEFGNELERYLSNYQDLRNKVLEIEKRIPMERKDAFFATIKYPVLCAADMARKQLESQEARSIARPGQFQKDEEALTAAANSMKAYNEILSLTEYYNTKLAGGKWNGSMSSAPRGLYVFLAPTLPEPITPQQIEKYADDNYEVDNLFENRGNVVVSNACNYSNASQGIYPIDMLGHSMRAIAIPAGGKLSYSFFAKTSGEARIRLAFIPTQPNDKGDLRFKISIDGGEPQVISLKEPFRSERWKLNVLRGQAIREASVNLSQGRHILEIQAVDDHIIFDQWMLDFQSDRQFYVFPTSASY